MGSLSVSAELIAGWAAAHIMKTVRHVPIILEGAGRIIQTTEETRQSSLDYEDTFTQSFREKPRRVHCGDVSCQDEQKSKQIRNIQDKHLLRNNSRSKSVEWINYTAREDQDSSDLTRKKSLNELNCIWNELQSLQLPTRSEGFEIKDSAFTSTPLLGRSDEIRSSSTESQNSVEAEIIPVKIKKSNISENFNRQHPDIYANLRSARKIWPENFDRMRELEESGGQSRVGRNLRPSSQKDESTQTERTGFRCRVS